MAGVECLGMDEHEAGHDVNEHEAGRDGSEDDIEKHEAGRDVNVHEAGRDVNEDDTGHDVNELDSGRDVDDEFRHLHYCYVFSLRPRRLSEVVVLPVCPPEVKKITKFLRVFEGCDFCTYVCTHDKPVAANKAVISCKMATVSLLQDFTSLSDGTPII